MFEHTALIGILRSEFPVIYNLVRLLPSFIFDIDADEKLVIRHGKDIIGRAKEGSVNRRNVFTGFLTGTHERATISDDSIIIEATGLVGAGGGTTSVTLTYLVWAVLSHPSVQARLEREVSQLSAEFTDTDLETLPYLGAVIQETLRLYGPVGGGLLRLVPDGGATLSGYHIPADTVVCTQSYSMHRNPELFPDPYR